VRITPRKAEVAEVVKLLEDPGYTSADALAKDVMKLVADLFAEREWFAYAWRTGSGAPVLAWGPFTSDNEARKFADKAALGGEHISVKLYSSASMLDRIAEQGKGKSKHCTTCTHPLGAHEHPANGNRCAVGRCACSNPTTD
jgi:hypothetical protein